MFSGLFSVLLVRVGKISFSHYLFSHERSCSHFSSFSYPLTKTFFPLNYSRSSYSDNWEIVSPCSLLFTFFPWFPILILQDAMAFLLILPFSFAFFPFLIFASPLFLLSFLIYSSILCILKYISQLWKISYYLLSTTIPNGCYWNFAKYREVTVQQANTVTVLVDWIYTHIYKYTYTYIHM